MCGVETGQSQRGQKSDQGIFTMPGKEKEPPGAGCRVRRAPRRRSCGQGFRVKCGIPQLGPRAPLSPCSTSCSLPSSLWASHPLALVDNTSFLPSGQKLLLCFLGGPARSRCTLQGFCMNPCTAPPGCGRGSHKSQPAFCTHLSLSSLQAFAHAILLPRGLWLCGLHCPGDRWRGTYLQTADWPGQAVWISVSTCLLQTHLCFSFFWPLK